MAGTSRGEMNNAFGAYVRSQRELAQLTLRQAAELANISNPYLSQIEHGLVLPSIAVMSALAEALSVSTETLLHQAAGVLARTPPAKATQTERAIRQDPRLDDGQKRALLAVLTSFLGSTSRSVPDDPARPDARRTSTAPRPAAAVTANPRRRKP